MARKKLTHHQSKQQNQTQQHLTPSPSPTPPVPMEEDSNVAFSDKLQNLKNLNSLLLKETAQRRQQVESLLEAKGALESAFNGSKMQQKLLKSQLLASADDNVALELEKFVALAVVENVVWEMGFRFDRLVAERSEMERSLDERGSEVLFLKGEVGKLNETLESERGRFGSVSREREQLKRDLDGVVVDVNGLREKLLETENRERELRDEVQKLSLEGEKLVKEGVQKERVMGEVMTERDLALRNLEEAGLVIEKLRGEMELVVREKDEILKVNNAQEVKITAMESELKSLNECIDHSSKEEALMREKIVELESSLGLALEKEEEMGLEIGMLVKQKEEMEVSVEMLREQKDEVQKVLDMVQKELKDKQGEIDETVRAKNEIEQVKAMCESEIVDLQREVDGLRDFVHKLKESCRDFEEKNKQLLSEVKHYRNSAEEVMLERDNIKREYGEEKNKVKGLTLQVGAREDKIEQMEAELGKMGIERQKLVEKNEMMETNVGVLSSEKDALQKRLLVAQQECDDLRAKVEFSCINSNQALAMLKSTAAALVVGSNDEQKKLPEEEEIIQPYAEQLDEIKKAFKSKNKMVADMKQQLVLLQNSVAEAQKMKSLWTVISSATTILAAALATYVAKGR